MTEIYFEAVEGKEDLVEQLPQRSTEGSAGYDFVALNDVDIPSMWDEEVGEKATIVPTGVKAIFGKDVALKLYSRSSLAIKRGLLLVNGIGLIDSDYYGNEDNDGEIMFAFKNTTRATVHLKKGDRIGQGVFEPVLLTTNDSTEGKERKGGIGSTGE